MKLGAVGHQHAPRAAFTAWRDVVARSLANAETITGVCSLAEGADQIFAELVLAHGARLEVVLPCRDYASAFTSDDARERYERLRRSAAAETILPFPEPSEAAFLAAGLVIVERVGELLALWDGLEARGLGGTADVVRYARAREIPCSIVWPVGTSR